MASASACACDNAPAFDLVQPIVMMKHCEVGVTTVHSRDAELAAVDPANSVSNLIRLPSVIFFTASLIEAPSWVRPCFGHFRDGQLEYTGLLHGGVDVRVECGPSGVRHGRW